MAEIARSFPQGLTYSVPFDTTTFVRASIEEVYKTLFEAGDPGADRDPGLPAGLARHAGADDHRAGHHHRRVRGHGRARLHRQSVDAVRHRARDRHRRGRRHRRGGGRSPPHRARHAGQAGGHPGHGRAVRPDHRHYAGADGGVPAGGVHSRTDRQDVRAVRAGDRGDCASQRDQCRHAQADPVRAVAAAAGPAGAAQPVLSCVQRRLWPVRERVCRPDRPHGGAQRCHVHRSPSL